MSRNHNLYMTERVCGDMSVKRRPNAASGFELGLGEALIGVRIEDWSSSSTSFGSPPSRSISASSVRFEDRCVGASHLSLSTSMKKIFKIPITEYIQNTP